MANGTGRVRPVPHLDLKNKAQAQIQNPDQWETGTIIGVTPSGKLEVSIDGAPDNLPTTIAPADSGVTAIGATVRLKRDSSGHIASVAVPDVMPDGETPMYLGATGQFVKNVADAQVELDSAIAGATADAAAAQSAAQSAANDAAAAMVDAANASAEASAVSGVAAAANDAAAAAQSAAGEAITVASTKTSVKASNTAPDSPMTNDIWFPLDDAGNVIGMKKWTGSRWVDYRLMAGSIVVPGSVGNVLLENGSVSAEKIFADEALWAKIATFASVTTDMLLAGGATITGTMLANVIQLASHLVAGDPGGDRTELDATGMHVWKNGVEWARLSAEGNGLQIYNPSMGRLVNLSASAFGMAVIDFPQRVDIPLPGTASAALEWRPGAWVIKTIGQWTATTNRAQGMSTTSLGDSMVARDFGVRCLFRLQNAKTGAIIDFTDSGNDWASAIRSTGPNMSFNIVPVTPGDTYNVILQAQAIKYVSAQGTPWIKNTRITLTPV